MKNAINKEKMVTTIGDFEDTILWMGCRFWLKDVTNSQNFAKNLAEKVVSRYWSGLSQIQLEKMGDDITREKEYAWGNTERCDTLLTLHKAYLEHGDKTFVPYPKCDEIEFPLIRMALLYACGRQTIASSMLPSEVIECRYDFLSDEQKNIIVSDLKSYLKSLEDHNIKPVFGNENIDNNTWQKFLAALDPTRHEQIELINGEVVTAFRTTSMRGKWNEKAHINEFSEEEVIYPLNSYLKQPHHEILIPLENIMTAKMKYEKAIADGKKFKCSDCQTLNESLNDVEDGIGTIAGYCPVCGHPVWWCSMQ